MPYQIGCDIGGTFTDIAVLDDDGELWTDKADTTPDHLVAGVRRAVENVSDQIGVSPTELLSDTERFINGTTIVTNNIVELDGAKTGLLTTKGFGDTLRIARSPRNDQRDHQQQHNVPELVSKDCVKEIPERSDYEGEAVVSLDEAAVRTAVEDLVENRGVEGIAVCYLWSFRNPEHEERTAEIIREMYPDLYVSVSNEVLPVIREYERMTTTTLNAYTGPDVSDYLEAFERELSELGLDPAVISIMQSAGGSTTKSEAQREPIRLIDSGPVGGVIGTQSVADQTDRENVIAADMGGTSFECSVIEDGEYSISQRTEIREFLTGLTKIDTTTIGAGGGSIARLDSRGVPKVGPNSAGADPGPACYGQGGTNPTLTDAMLVLGFLSPDSFLGGRRDLDVSAAEDTLRATVADPLGYTLEEAAAAVYEVAINSMSNAVRGVTVEEGNDPQEFPIMAYGGALPMFVADICATLGIEKAIIPRGAPVFSAYGLLQTDDVRTLSETLYWDPGDPVDDINTTLDRLTKEITDRLTSKRFDDEDISIRREGLFKFEGQLFDFPVTLPDGPIDESYLEQLEADFPEMYEGEYGSGTAWVDAPVVLRAVRVTGTGHTDKFAIGGRETGTSTPTGESREVYLPVEGEYGTVTVYDGAELHSGHSVEGPALLEEDITTVFIPSEQTMSVDTHGNYVIDAKTSDHERAGIVEAEGGDVA
jgi:N-methylhydantoinase A